MLLAQSTDQMNRVSVSVYVRTVIETLMLCDSIK